MTSRTGECACGGLRVTVTGEPRRVSICHCDACQRRSGSSFGAQARYGVDQVKHEGPDRTWVRIADSGNEVTFRLCPTCGTTVSWRIEGRPDDVMVAIGIFADRTFPPPGVSVYDVRRHPWITPPEDAEIWD